MKTHHYVQDGILISHKKTNYECGYFQINTIPTAVHTFINVLTRSRTKSSLSTVIGQSKRLV